MISRLLITKTHTNSCYKISFVVSWLHAGARFDINDPTSSFVEGLGAGQIVSRQALASPYLGDIQLSLSDRKGNLEVEVIRARRLQSKPGSKVLPCKYISTSSFVSATARTLLITVNLSINPC